MSNGPLAGYPIRGDEGAVVPPVPITMWTPTRCRLNCGRASAQGSGEECGPQLLEPIMG